ncbi:hypothetical protein [Moorena sp. SIO3I6]|uniref:hypothetical protein n=1 Tax=Moorena sp. SIO3I6 TaxID=2607831 RepID=UPI0013F74CAB|nr:hypothetical protein [Moorena sp. SIO3I6]NEP28772.1 hypothetical protein [Moorena sp. SIO3I6]
MGVFFTAFLEYEWYQLHRLLAPFNFCQSLYPTPGKLLGQLTSTFCQSTSSLSPHLPISPSPHLPTLSLFPVPCSLFPKH